MSVLLFNIFIFLSLLRQKDLFFSGAFIAWATMGAPVSIYCTLSLNDRVRIVYLVIGKQNEETFVVR